MRIKVISMPFLPHLDLMPNRPNTAGTVHSRNCTKIGMTLYRPGGCCTVPTCVIVLYRLQTGGPSLVKQVYLGFNHNKSQYYLLIPCLQFLLYLMSYNLTSSILTSGVSSFVLMSFFLFSFILTSSISPSFLTSFILTSSTLTSPLPPSIFSLFASSVCFR